MKKLLSFFTLIVMLSTACSKDDSGDSSNSYVKFKVNGNSKAFNHVQSTVIDDSNPNGSGAVHYDIKASEQSNALNQATFGYAQVSNNEYISEFSITLEGITYETMGIVDPLNFTIEITESKKEYIKGYFAGKMYIKNSKDKESEFITIEQGEFNIQF